MSSPAPLPIAWVDRLFTRFVAMYGSQKVGAMWADADMSEIKAVWAEALGKFQGESVAGAIRSLIDSGSQWPPTLPEFVEACRLASVSRRDHGDALKALPAPGNAETDTEAAKRQIERIKAMLGTTFIRIE